MLYIYVHIDNSGYIYIYKIAKDPMSHELSLEDSKMQSSVYSHFSTQPFQDKAAHIQNNQITTGPSKNFQ